MENFFQTFWDTLKVFFNFLNRSLIENGRLQALYDWACDHVIGAAIVLVLISIGFFWSAKTAKNIALVAGSVFLTYCGLSFYFQPHEEEYNIFILAILVASGFGIFLGVYRLKRMF